MACSHTVQLVRAALCSKTQLQLYLFLQFADSRQERCYTQSRGGE